MNNTTIRIGSRGSDLALWQARWVQHQLTELHPGVGVTIEVIKTKGDKILDSPLAKIGDKGLFTREIEEQLLAGRIDVAVHSLKDLPTVLPAGLTIGAIPERGDVRDVFLPHPRNPVRTLLEQPAGATIATGSLRRRSQLLHLRPDTKVLDIRGNLNTRFKRLEASDWAGTILARAGLIRLGWEDRIGETLPADSFLPAVGQGALGVEIRSDDTATANFVQPLTHQPTWDATTAERSLLHALEGGCQIPVGAFARVEHETLHLHAIVGSLDGRKIVRGSISGRPGEAWALGNSLAGTLRRDGADEILSEIRAEQ